MWALISWEYILLLKLFYLALYLSFLSSLVNYLLTYTFSLSLCGWIILYVSEHLTCAPIFSDLRVALVTRNTLTQYYGVWQFISLIISILSEKIRVATYHISKNSRHECFIAKYMISEYNFMYPTFSNFCLLKNHVQVRA